MAYDGRVGELSHCLGAQRGTSRGTSLKSCAPCLGYELQGLGPPKAQGVLLFLLNFVLVNRVVIIHIYIYTGKGIEKTCPCAPCAQTELLTCFQQKP